MNIEFKKMVGQTEFTFHVESNGIKDFFEKVSEYEDIPTKGPNGEDDLKISFRKTKEGHKYYSVVCQSAKQEFKFGQSTDNVSMFPKGWEPLYEGGNDQPESQNNAANSLGQQQNYQVQQPANSGLNQQQSNVPPQNNQQDTQYQNMQTTPAGQQNAAVNDVLAKYGLGN